MATMPAAMARAVLFSFHQPAVFGAASRSPTASDGGGGGGGGDKT